MEVGKGNGRGKNLDGDFTLEDKVGGTGERYLGEAVIGGWDEADFQCLATLDINTDGRRCAVEEMMDK